MLVGCLLSQVLHCARGRLQRTGHLLLYVLCAFVCCLPEEFAVVGANRYESPLLAMAGALGRSAPCSPSARLYQPLWLYKDNK